MDVLKDRELLIKTVTALKNLNKSKEMDRKNNGLKQLFPDDEIESCAKVSLVISLIKLPPIPKDGKPKPMTIRSPIPHSFVNKFTNILLITRNLRGHKLDIQPTVNAFRDRLREHGALGLVTEIMPRTQLCTEYRDFENRRNLAQRFDIVLCDKSIISKISKELGKPFYSIKKRPIPVNLEAKDLKTVIKKCLSRSILHMNLEGSCSTMQIGRMDQTPTEVANNILSTIKMWKKCLPGGWDNVRSVNLKSENSKSLPLYLSLTCPSEIPPVVHPHNIDENETVAFDRLNTHKGNVRVEVKRSGDVNVHWKIKQLEDLKKVNRQKKGARYDPVTNKIIRDGEVVVKKKMPRKKPEPRRWIKKPKRTHKRKLLTAKLGAGKKFVQRKRSKK